MANIPDNGTLKIPKKKKNGQTIPENKIAIICEYNSCFQNGLILKNEVDIII